MYHAPTGREVTRGDVRQRVAPSIPGRILPTDDYQFVGEPQFGVELDYQKLVVSESTRVEPTSTGSWQRGTHGGVYARRLEMSGHADVEPQLIQVVWNATTDMAAERVANVVVDRLQCVAIRIACSKCRSQNIISVEIESVE